MTKVNYSDGNILTAGSLNAHYYQLIANGSAATSISTSNAGNLFSDTIAANTVKNGIMVRSVIQATVGNQSSDSTVHVLIGSPTAEVEMTALNAKIVENQADKMPITIQWWDTTETFTEPVSVLIVGSAADGNAALLHKCTIIEGA